MNLDEEMARRTLRRPVRMAVLFRPESTGTSESLGRAVNISESGLRFDVNRPCEVDAALLLRFQLPGEPKGLHLRARVRWVDREERKEVYAHGVEFMEVSLEQRESLVGYVARSIRAPRSIL